MDKVIVGVDIGGTTIKIGLISADGSILEKWEIVTDTTNNGKRIVQDIWNSIATKLVERKIDIKDVLGIGVGAPGFVEAETGLVFEAVNIGWHQMNIKEQLEEKSALPVFVQNDANIAALGENWMGAGQGATNMIAVTLGTGVGGGMIANGSILNGTNGMAGEIGHIKVEPNGLRCNCGGIGCLETICSATGIVKQGMNAIESDSNSRLASHYEETGKITAKDIIDLAKNGDEQCLQIIDHTADMLGKALANIATVINPSKIIIGGGVSKAGDFFIGRIEAAFRSYAVPKLEKVCEVKVAQLCNDAGILGGAYLVLQCIER